MTKAEIRKALLAAREIAHKTEGSGDPSVMAAWLRRQIKPGQVLGSYKPIKTERDPGPVTNQLELTMAFPRVMGKGRPLEFFTTSGPQDFEPRSFGVMEPLASLPKVVPDVILVPLVGFDRSGFRLGYGGGFYDRTLSGFRSLKPFRAIGFAYDGQFSKHPLNFESTDLALDDMMTPMCRYEFGDATKVIPWC